MKNKPLTPEQLNQIPHDVIVSMYLQQVDAYQTLLRQNEELLQRIASLDEKVAVLTQQLFGRKTERKKEIIDDAQIRFHFGEDDPLALNEAEVLVENGMPEEPAMETVVIRRKKRKGKREQDLRYVEVQEITHELPEYRLQNLFPNGYDRLPDEIYSELEYVPAKFVRNEHHIAVYAGKRGEGVVRADRPERLLSNSILTPGLAAAIFNSKYVNAIPLNRLAEEFARQDVNISRQVMAGWMIKLTERYLTPVYRSMKRKLLEGLLIHCDETPFDVIRDGKGPNSKNYMWVYHSYERYGTAPVFIYEYQPTRNARAPREFLKDYTGILVTDGYQVYHTIAGERPDDLIVAGCWEHAKRKFADLVKSIGRKKAGGTLAGEAVHRIAAIYHVDNMRKEASDEERHKHRQESVKPLVDAYFAWLKSLNTSIMDKSGPLYRAIQYSLNQEPYLRRFLDNPIIPLDNNDAERSIRKFCVGKHNWHVIATPKGAESSAILYSIAETARANGLKPFEYFQYLLEQILDHLDDPPSEYLDGLMPWSERLPEICRKKAFTD